jgi:gas vesicle structural protein
MTLFSKVGRDGSTLAPEREPGRSDVLFGKHHQETAMARVMKSTDSSSLAEVVDRILDKGIVIDAWIKVSLVGIELITIEARVVVASVETYLKYAEAIGLTASAATPA